MVRNNLKFKKTTNTKIFCKIFKGIKRIRRNSDRKKHGGKNYEIVSKEFNSKKRYNIDNCKSFKTPIERNLQLEKCKSDDITSKTYSELVGCLMYIMLGIVCYTISFFQQISIFGI